MNEPTEAQVKEFWEWCGFSYTGNYSRYWESPDTPPISFVNLPHIDLNNLFKFAVPKVLEWHTIIETYSFKQNSKLYYSETGIWDRNESVLKGNRVGFAFAQSIELEEAEKLSRFWAIWEVIDERTAEKENG